MYFKKKEKMLGDEVWGLDVDRCLHRLNGVLLKVEIQAGVEVSSNVLISCLVPHLVPCGANK